MQNNKGFTLMEMAIVIAIIGIISAIASPSILSWRNTAKIRGAGDNIRGNLQLAKITAVKTNTLVAIQFNVNEDSYSINGVEKKLPAGVTIENGYSQSFNTRGIPTLSGSLRITDASGNRKRDIFISRLGQVSMKRSDDGGNTWH